MDTTVHAGSNSGLDITSVSVEINQPSVSPRRKYVCSHTGCTAAFKRRPHLRRHLDLMHSNMDRVACAKCGKSFANEHQLVKHLKAHDKRVYSCSHSGCQHAFLKHQHLKIHEYVHTGIKPFACAACGKRFLVPSKLRSHMKIHDGYRCSFANCDAWFDKWTLLRHHVAHAHAEDFACPQCSASFEKPCWLEKHIAKVHGKEVKCPFCAASFLPSFIEAHVAHNHGAEAAKAKNAPANGGSERRHVCDRGDCRKAFQRPAHLRRHVAEVHDKLKTQKRRLECDVDGCKRTFPTLAAMTQHKEIAHEGAKLFACTMADCEKHYTTRYGLKRHMIASHGVLLRDLEFNEKVLINGGVDESKRIGGKDMADSASEDGG